MDAPLKAALAVGTAARGADARTALPAAVSAPAALVIAVELPVAQETTACVQVLPAATPVDAGHVPTSVEHSSVRTRTAVQVPPPRGTPV